MPGILQEIEVECCAGSSYLRGDSGPGGVRWHHGRFYIWTGHGSLVMIAMMHEHLRLPVLPSEGGDWRRKYIWRRQGSGFSDRHHTNLIYLLHTRHYSPSWCCGARAALKEVSKETISFDEVRMFRLESSCSSKISLHHFKQMTEQQTRTQTCSIFTRLLWLLGMTGNYTNPVDNSDDAETFLYREEVGELAVEELLQLALVEFVLVSIVSGVVVENCYERVHRTLELSRHSAGRTRNGEQPAVQGRKSPKANPAMSGGALTCLESHASVAKRRSAACLSVIEEKLGSPSSLRG